MIWAIVWAAFWAHSAWVDRRHPYSYRECLLGVLSWTLWAAIDAVWMPDVASAVVEAGYAGWWAHLAWKRRPPRKRKPSRVAGRVRGKGHRLVVTP